MARVLGLFLIAFAGCESALLEIEGGDVVDFGDVRSGDRATRYVKVLNNGTAGATLTELVRISGVPVRITGLETEPTSFNIWFPPGGVVPPAEYLAMKAEYIAPNAEASRVDEATLELRAMDAIRKEEITKVFTLTARVVAEPCDPLAPLDFGTVSVGARAMRSFELVNTLPFASRTFVGLPESTTEDHAAFSLDPATPPGNSQENEATRDAGAGVRQVIVWFEPTRAGAFTAWLPVRPASGCALVHVPLSGTAQ